MSEIGYLREAGTAMFCSGRRRNRQDGVLIEKKIEGKIRSNLQGLVRCIQHSRLLATRKCRFRVGDLVLSITGTFSGARRVIEVHNFTAVKIKGMRGYVHPDTLEFALF